MIEVQTSDMMICRSSEGVLGSAWKCSASAYASAVITKQNTAFLPLPSTNHDVRRLSLSHLTM